MHIHVGFYTASDVLDLLAIHLMSSFHQKKYSVSMKYAFFPYYTLGPIKVVDFYALKE